MRAIVNRPSKLRITTEDDTGTVFDLDAPPAVTITDTLVDAQVASGTMTRTGLGLYEYAFGRNALTPLSAAWAGTAGGLDISGVEPVRVVDRRSVPLSVLRADTALAGIDPVALIGLVDGAEDALETALRFRIVTTMDRVTVTIVRPQRVLRLPGPNYIQQVVAGTWRLNQVGPVTAIDVANVAVRDDALELPYGTSWDFLTGGFPTAHWLPGTYTFDLVHGLPETPIDLQKAVRMLVRHYALQGGQNLYPDRASKIISADTEIWFARSGPDTYFGVPEVDAVVTQRRLDLPIADNTTY